MKRNGAFDQKRQKFRHARFGKKWKFWLILSRIQDMVPFTMLMVRAFSETSQMLPYAKDLESLTSKLNIAKSKESLQNAKARIDPSIPDINFLGMLSMHS